MFTAINTTEIVIDYSSCEPTINISEKTCEKYLERAAIDDTLELCYCNYGFTLNKPITGMVYIYYRIKNFYQNERSYASSIDFNQLGGSSGSPSSDCEPFRTMTVNFREYNIAPCGTIANTMFNDSFSIVYKNNNLNTTVPLIKTGIAYSYDKKFRFKNPPHWNGTIKPPSWRKTAMELDPSDSSNNGYENEDLMVWLRPGAFESPRKLHRFVNRANDPFKDGLPAGEYTLVVEFNFPVAMFGGRKSIILSNSSWIGTVSLFLPIIYIILGISSLITAVVLFILSRE